MHDCWIACLVKLQKIVEHGPLDSTVGNIVSDIVRLLHKHLVYATLRHIHYGNVVRNCPWLCVLKVFFSKDPFISSIIHRRVSQGSPVRLEPRPSLRCYVWLAQMSESLEPLGVVLSLSLVFLIVGHFHSGPQALVFYFSVCNCQLQMWLFVYSMFPLCFSS